MHDIRAIRDNPAAYDKGWAARGLSAQTPAILALDAELRAAQTALQAAQSRRNEASKLIGMAKAKKDEAEAAELMAEVERLKAVIAEQGELERATATALRALLASLPNLPADDVPLGEDESGQRRGPPLGRAVRHPEPRRTTSTWAQTSA